MKNQIEKLKSEKNAIILAHYYTPQEAQSVADYVGDSFYLAKMAKETSADIIVFCGVSFMGESAKLLNPGKKVLMPDLTADCPMGGVYTSLLSEYRGGSLSLKTTFMQAQHGFRLLTLTSLY